MYTRRNKGWEKHTDFIILDLIAMAVAFYIGYIVRHGYQNNAFFYREDYWRLLLVLVVIDICVMFFNESYKSIVRRGYVVELKETLQHCLGVDGVMLLYLFLIQQTEIYSRTSISVFCVLQIILTYAIRCAHKKQLRQKMKTSPNLEQMLILTDKAHAQECVEELTKNQYQNYNIVGMILKDVELLSGYQMSEGQKEEQRVGSLIWEMAAAYEAAGGGTEAIREIAGVPVVAGYYQIYDYLLNHVVDSVFVCADMSSAERKHMAEHLIQSGVTVHLQLIRLEKNLPNRAVEKIGNYTVLTSGMRLATSRQLFLKRAMDILGGLVGILITCIITVFLAPIIFFQSPGPIFFKQERVGRNGRTFQIYKFRSMYMDAEERKKELMEQNEMDGLMFKMENDPRIIPVGHFIRRFSIDEFPQFFNVLKGEMSLVGTRPPTVDEFEQYSLHHRGRLSSKPGITGLWQVSGRSDITDFEQVVELDTDYIANWSISEDIRIIWQTVKLVFTGKGAK